MGIFEKLGLSKKKKTHHKELKKAFRKEGILPKEKLDYGHEGLKMPKKSKSTCEIPPVKGTHVKKETKEELEKKYGIGHEDEKPKNELKPLKPVQKSAEELPSLDTIKKRLEGTLPEEEPKKAPEEKPKVKEESTTLKKGPVEEVLYGNIFKDSHAKYAELQNRVEELEKMMAVFNKNWAEYQEIVNEKLKRFGRVIKDENPKENEELITLKELVQRIEKENAELKHKLEESISKPNVDLEKKTAHFEEKISGLEEKLGKLDKKREKPKAAGPVILE